MLIDVCTLLSQLPVYNPRTPQVSCYADQQISCLNSRPFSLCSLRWHDMLHIIKMNLAAFYVLNGYEKVSVV